MFKKLFKKNATEKRRTVIARSNIVQYDDMGYALRLCIMDDGKQEWLDSCHQDNDIEIRWQFKDDIVATNI